jgi:GT2 family glycosyltransferase
MPKASVIVCTYNREEAVCDLLSDLFSQRFHDLEIILVDQTPAHAATTTAFLSRHEGRFRHLRLDTPNLPAARNAGVTAATGEIVVFMDDDIRVDPDFVERVAGIFADDRISAMAPMVVPDPPEPGWDSPRRRLGWRPGPVGMRPVRACIGACFAVRRSVFLALGGADPVIGRLNGNHAAGEDYEFTRRLTRARYRLCYVPGIRVRHVGGIAGGCEFRTGPTAFDLRPHVRSNAYTILKEERSFERLTLRALLRLVRLTSFRRDVLVAGPVAFARGLARIRPLVADVRSFVRADSASAAGVPVERVHHGAPL